MITIAVAIVASCQVASRAARSPTELAQQLRTAVAASDGAGVAKLLKAGAPLTHIYGENTVLHLAVIAGDLKVVEQLVSAGAPLNAQTTDTKRYGVDGDILPGKRTPLYEATLRDKPEIARFLVKSGAQTSLADDCGLMPIHAAALMGNVDVVTALLDGGVNPKVKSQDGFTYSDYLLLYYAGKGDPALVREQLAQGANPLVCLPEGGETALHRAIVPHAPSEPRLQIIDSLLLAGADPKRMDSSGETPLAKARRLQKFDPTLKQAIELLASS